MSSVTLQQATTALSTGIIIAIVVPCVIVGIAIIIFLAICIYCCCCRKPKTQPGMVLQGPPGQPYGQQPAYGNPPVSRA